MAVVESTSTFNADPASGAPGGFTLVELMGVVAVAAIVLTLGVPSFFTLIQNNRAATQVNELVMALSLARSEAVKRGVPVSMCPSKDQSKCSGGKDWQVGWLVFVDAAAAESADPVVGEVLRVWPKMTGVTGFSGPTSLRYLAEGDVRAGAVFKHTKKGCPANKPEARTVTVSPTGRASVAPAGCLI
ncbi:GspH/FimT family pseudopilin [Thiocapsa sp.]|uniref:GspH/FimT family pseudopilin n=1 Tax=Thiocapsa sp. TaxID=2024551 RepID=UPI0025CDF0FF|nr:GspH/FimT family pseudopilin [Thiocapsa sp.]